jgi:hypothetical protein
MVVSLVRALYGKVIDGGCWGTNSHSRLYLYFIQLLYVEDFFITLCLIQVPHRII